MGLTNQSTGLAVAGAGEGLARTSPNDRVVALAGNPNVGKSTVFNALTGLNQHTGNWPGKTVTNARGAYHFRERRFIMVDIPGTYSLMASSVEEEVARDFVCFGGADAIVVVADATSLERNLNLVLQILEVTPRAVVCVNLLDEARKKGILIDLELLAKRLGVPVVGTSARAGQGLDALMDRVYGVCEGATATERALPTSPPAIEAAIVALTEVTEPLVAGKLEVRWACVKLLDMDDTLRAGMAEYLGVDLPAIPAVAERLAAVRGMLERAGISPETVRDHIVSSIVTKGEELYRACVKLKNPAYNGRDRALDRVLTSKATGIPIMILLLGFIFWLTIIGANYPSELLSNLLFGLEDKLAALCASLGAPGWVKGLFVDGMYRTLAWVVSVMLPPMAIFFPLFTLMEDAGYLPRIAFNLDSYFKKACAHGKQALTMCMGFGCNACGVIGCRIIDSPRERLIAILTNNFVPCNGRFPTLIALITMFFVGTAGGVWQSVLSTLMLTGVIVLGVCMTLAISKLLSRTILKGMPSSFALELPPYRMPQVGKVIVRSIFDRTLFVLGRAVAVAAPAGLLIWGLANVSVGGVSLLNHCTGFLDPFARLIGLDGAILMAFILGFPANEIVLPIIIMTYMASGSMLEFDSLVQLRALLVSHGWTWVTALCTMLFSLFHFPCGTTCWTIKKETGSWKWTLLSILIPTATGIVVCFLVATIGGLFL